MADSQAIRQVRDTQSIIGHAFGRLVVQSKSDHINKGHGRYWNCLCECGTNKRVRADHLKSGKIASCGCINRTQDGLSGTREGAIWGKMIARCYRDENDNFRFYGGCGHYVCARWRESIANFVADVGIAPSKLHTLDRINTHGSYTCGHCDECREKQQPANCRWATKAEQCRNCKNNLWFTHDGETLILKDWARKIGMRYLTLYGRVVLRKWSFEKSVTTPVKKLSRCEVTPHHLE